MSIMAILSSHSFLVSVRFEYEVRPDPFSQYRAGFEVRTIRRCTAVRMFTHAGREPLLVRTLRLTFLDQTSAPRPSNGASLLARIQVVGHDGAARQKFAQLEFNYTRFQPANRRFFAVSRPDLPPLSLAAPDYDVADLNGNGLSDNVEMNGAIRYWRNRRHGVFDYRRRMEEAPSGSHLSDIDTPLIEATETDARTSWYWSADMRACYPSAFEGGWNRRSFRAYEATPTVELKDSQVRFVDLNGDGITRSSNQSA